MSRISDHIRTVTQLNADSAESCRGNNAFARAPLSITEDLRNQAQALLGGILRSKTGSGQTVRFVGITSCYRKEGVSTIARLLARTGACQRKVLLVDANLAHPSVHEYFGIQPTPGLLQAISGETMVRNAIRSYLPDLSLLASGTASDGPDHFLPTDLFLPLFPPVAAQYDLILVDLPAVTDDSSTIELCGLLDGVALVVEAERVHWQAGLRAATRLRQSGAPLLGAVLNKRRDYIPDWLYRVL